MTKRIQQGFMKIMPTSLIAILVTGLFLFTAVQHLSTGTVFAETAAGFTVTNNGSDTYKGGDSAVVMQLELPAPATDMHLAGATVAGTGGNTSFPAGWNMYGYDSEAGQFSVITDWLGFDNGGTPGKYDATDTTIAGTAPTVGETIVNMNVAKPAGWTDLMIYDGGVAGTWELATDMIWNNDNGTGFYNADNLNSIRFGNPGTCNDGDIAKFEVFEDTNGSGTYDAGDALIGSKAVAPFIGQSMPTTGSIYTAASSQRTIFFVVTFAANPTHGCTFQAKLPFTVAPPYAAQFASGDDGPDDVDVDTTDVITIDSVAPSFVVTTRTVDSDADGTVDQIVVDFDENITIIDTGGAGDGLPSLAVSNGCTIASGDYSTVGLNSVTLNLTGCTPNDTSITPTVTYTAVADCTANGSICDMVGNQMANSASIGVVDGAHPVILNREYLSSGNNGTVDRLRLTFSEAVTWTGNKPEQFLINNRDLLNYSTANAPEGLVGGSGTNSLVLSTSGTTDRTGVSGGNEPTLWYIQAFADPDNNVKDMNGLSVLPESAAVSIQDKAAPFRYIFIGYEDNLADGSVDRVVMYFTENVTYTYQDSDWTAVPNQLTNFDVTGCLNCVNVNQLRLTATADANITGVATTEPTLAYTAGNPIADTAGNQVADFGPITMLDSAGPVVISGTYLDNNGDGTIDAVELRFTENVNFTMNGADWSWGVPGDMNLAGDFDVTECAGTGTSTITCTDLGTGTFSANVNETGGLIQPRWDYNGVAGVDDGPNGMGSRQITLLDGAAPAYKGAAAINDTTVQLYMTEPVSSVTFGAAGAWTASGLTVSGVAINGGDPSILDLTVASLGNTAYAAADFAYTAGLSGSNIQDVAANSTAGFGPRPIADAQAPVLVGAQPVLALKQDGTAPAIDTNVWYYYGGDSLRFTVTASEPLNEVRACVRSLTGNNSALTCDAAQFAGVEFTDYIKTNTNPGGFTYSFNVPLVALAGTPAGVDGYPINIRLEDANANMGYGTTNPESLIAVFNVVPTTIDGSLGGTTTDWSTITDYTAATNLIFEKAGNIGKLEFAGPINLTAPATITALQNLSTNVITGGNNPTGTSILGIRSDNLAAFDTAATLTALMPTAVRPGLIVYDNAGTQIGTVPNDQAGNIVIGGNTLGTFSWNAGAQTMSWTTTGFSSFGTDSTGPIVTDGNISIAGATGTGGAYKIGDTVTVTWNNSAAGDNNGADLSSATANLTAFGGGAAVAMTDTTACGGTAGDDIYEACYTILGTEGIDATNLNAVVTAYDAVGNPSTTADTSNATVDTIAPVIGTPGSLTITLDNNANSVANIGDTVTYNNAVAGAPDGDTFSVNLTALTGTAVATSAGSPYAVILGTLTGNQTFTETVTDNAGNTATGVTQALAVDNRSLLTATNVTPASTQTSASTTYTFAFTTNTNWPADGKLKVTFPAGFNVAALDTQVADNLSNVDGVLTVTDVTGQVVTITRDGSGALVPAGTAVSLRVGNGTNSATAGATGTFTFLTTTSADTAIDINDAVPGFTLTAPAVPPAPTEPTTTGGGGGGGGTGATTNPTSNATTTTAVATITTLEGDQSYSSPVQFKQEDITVDEDNGTASAQLTGEGSLTLKPNSKSTISVHFPPNTTVTGPADWNGRIDPPVTRSLTMIMSKGETIEGSKDKLMREDVAAIVKVGASVPLQFSQEVTLEIPVDLPDGSVVLLYTSQDGNTWSPSGEGVVQSGKLIVKTKHFSYFAVAMTDETKTAAEMAAVMAKGGFADIVGHWAEAYINQIRDLGIVNGKTETAFAPNDYITRAELSKIATLAFGVEIDPNPGLSPFSDVPLSDWFAPYVVAARNAGIVQGYEGNIFSPNGLINRAEALKIILEAKGFSAVAAEARFSDVPVNTWYAGYVTFASKNGVVSGKSEGRFAPGESITRAEVAKVIAKVMEMDEPVDEEETSAE